MYSFSQTLLGQDYVIIDQVDCVCKSQAWLCQVDSISDQAWICQVDQCVSVRLGYVKLDLFLTGLDMSSKLVCVSVRFDHVK